MDANEREWGWDGVWRLAGRLRLVPEFLLCVSRSRRENRLRNVSNHGLPWGRGWEFAG